MPDAADQHSVSPNCIESFCWPFNRMAQPRADLARHPIRRKLDFRGASLRADADRPPGGTGYELTVFSPPCQKPSNTFMRRSGEVETVKVHDFVPHRYKVAQELLL